jgi:hypothetical protein
MNLAPRIGINHEAHAQPEEDDTVLFLLEL